MSAHDYPQTAFGVELRTKEGWVLLDSIHRTCVRATKLRQSLTGQHGYGAGDLRVVELTITRKGDTK